LWGIGMSLSRLQFRNSSACRYVARVRGESLIEVMLAVVLTAVTALGLIAAQLWMMREARATATREHAALVADALVEAMQGASHSSAALAQWRTRAGYLLPQGEASVSGASDRTSVARVTWHTLAGASRSGDVIDMPPPCGDVAVPAGTGCVALAFAE
jgi:Tfp pilus assembly protein PilV